MKVFMMVGLLPVSTDFTTMTFSTAEISALRSLIEFHDDWDEVSELLGTDIDTLYEKVCALDEVIAQ